MEHHDNNGTAYNGPTNAGHGAAVTSHGVAGHLVSGVFVPDKK